MPATAADIAAGTREASIATWSDNGVRARYPSALDGLGSPATGFFDSLADAQAVANARGVLLGADRRRFGVEVAEALWIDPSLALPQVRLVDGELAADTPGMALRYSVNLETEATSFELLG